MPRLHIKTALVQILFVVVVTLTLFSIFNSYYVTTSCQKKNEPTLNNINHRKILPEKLQNTKILPDHFPTDEVRETLHQIKIAHRYIKNGKAAKPILKAIHSLEQILKTHRDQHLELSKPSKANLTSINSLEVCPEKYMGSLYGYPFFHKGFEITNCTRAKPMKELVTIVVDPSLQRREIVETILRGVEDIYPGIGVICKEYGSDISPKFNLSLRQVKVASNDDFNGPLWNALIAQAKTPYVFIARDTVRFTNDSRLERLVRVSGELGVDFVGGAPKNDQNGHWNLGCHQLLVKNWTLSYRAGYEWSEAECLYCDHLLGPFLARTEKIKAFQFPKNIPSELIFEHFFVKTNLRGISIAVSCPDAMFYVNHTQQKYRKSESWKYLARDFRLDRVKLHTGATFTYNCSETGINCVKYKGMAVAPCCLQQLADFVKFYMKTCDEHNIYCELEEGTALGAVKMGKVLPWERDADLHFLTSNYSAMMDLRKHFSQAGYHLTAKENSLWCCVDGRQAGGVMRAAVIGWSIEIYGLHMMDAELLVETGLQPTRALYDGQWVTLSRNPGLTVRNRYGPDVYRHAQHWLTTGKSSGWDRYDTSGFTQCSEPGHHSCLDQYLADGNIQFDDNYI